MRSAERRPWLLLVVLVGCSSVWVATLVARPDRVAPSVLSLQDLGGVPAVQRVHARPPSLYVELGADEWWEMTERERLDALEAIGRVAREAGYLGVHARTTDGAAAGEWLRDRGSSLAKKTLADT